MKKVKLASLSSMQEASAVLSKEGNNFGFMDFNLNRLNRIQNGLAVGETIEYRKTPMLLVIQNLTDGHMTSVFLAYGSTIVAISNNTQHIIAINNENSAGKITLKCTSTVLTITNNMATAQGIRLVGISL